MEQRRDRDYLAGSVVIVLFLRFVEGLSQRSDRFFEKAVAMIGVKQAFSRTDSFRVFAAVLASAIVSNGLALILTRREIAPWGVVLRVIGLGVALLGLLCRNDLQSLRETSIFIRLVRFFRKILLIWQ